MYLFFIKVIISLTVSCFFKFMELTRNYINLSSKWAQIVCNNGDSIHSLSEVKISNTFTLKLNGK